MNNTQTGSSVTVVTGGCGFIGSNIIKKLNSRSEAGIVILDLYDELKYINLKNLSFINFISYQKELNEIEEQLDEYSINFILHMGGNSNVLVTDRNIMMEDNFVLSKFYLNYCLKKQIPFIYASTSAVYGNVNKNTVNPTNSDPLNAYSWSKWLFDQYCLENNHNFQSRVIGLRFFNVFGLGEFHKGKNASIPYRFFKFLDEYGSIELFDKEILRDYVWVEDVADVIVNIMQDQTIKNGIYNLGSGIPVSHREVSELVVNAFVEKGIKTRAECQIKTVPIPRELINRFQFYTKAEGLLDMIRNQTTGNKKKISQYINQLIAMKYS